MLPLRDADELPPCQSEIKAIFYIDRCFVCMREREAIQTPDQNMFSKYFSYHRHTSCHKSAHEEKVVGSEHSNTANKSNKTAERHIKSSSWYKNIIIIIGSCSLFRTKFTHQQTHVIFIPFPVSGLYISLRSTILRLILNPSLAWQLNTAAQR